MEKAIKILKKDHILKDILDLPIDIPTYDGHVDTYLYSSIISQQLSIQSAKAIHDRFLDHFGEKPPPEQIINTPDEDLRDIGLSRSKANYIKNVATYFKDNDDQDWDNMTDDEIIKELTTIKGVGVWTVQMVLMFCLARRDVFPILDLGVRESAIELYGIQGDKKSIEKQLIKIAEKWRPYRSIASLYLWSYRNEGAK